MSCPLPLSRHLSSFPSNPHRFIQMGCCSGSSESRAARLDDFSSHHSKKYPKPGLTTRRFCRDIFFTLFFWVFWAGLIAIAYYSVISGDPDRLIYGEDYEGNVCGKDNRQNTALQEGLALAGSAPRDHTLNTNLYYLFAFSRCEKNSLAHILTHTLSLTHSHTLTSIESFMISFNHEVLPLFFTHSYSFIHSLLSEDSLSGSYPRVCLSECPTVTSLDSVVCLYPYQNNNTLDDISNGHCFFSYASYSVLNRCVHDLVVNLTTSAAEELALQDMLEQVVAAIYASGQEIGIALLAAFVLGFVWLLLMR